MMSIRSRILSFAVLATVVPSLGLGVFSFWRYQSLISENVELELRTQTNYVRSEATLWLRERLSEVRAISNANTLVGGLQTRRSGLDRDSRRDAPGPSAQPGASGLDETALALYLRSVRSRLDSFLELTLFDVDGRVLASSGAPTLTTMPTAWHGLPADHSEIVLAMPRWESQRATATMAVVVPVRSPRDARLGSLAAVLDLGRLQPRLSRTIDDSPAETIVLTPVGRPLIATHGPTTDLTAIDPATLLRLHRNPDRLTNYVGHRRQDVVGLAEVSETMPFLVISERERSDVYQAWLRRLRLFLGLVAGSTLIVGAVAYWMGRSIVRPLDGLVDAADRIGAGDLDVRQRVDDEAEIGRLARAFNAMVARLRESRAQTEAATEALQRQNELLERLSITDALTGLANRKRLNDILAAQFARFRRMRRPFTVVMLDIDHFKKLNDTHGHLVGDRVLAHVASLVKGAVRDVDAVARYGGEEFAVILDEATPDGAMETAERIRASVEATPIELPEGRIATTVSVGVARGREQDRRPEDVLGRADAALYEAKRAGRNRVIRAL